MHLRHYTIRLRRSQRLPYRLARVMAILLPVAVVLLVLISRR